MSLIIWRMRRRGLCFFWGDVVGLGIVKKEELPEGLWERCKVVDY